MTTKAEPAGFIGETRLRRARLRVFRNVALLGVLALGEILETAMDGVGHIGPIEGLLLAAMLRQEEFDVEELADPVGPEASDAWARLLEKRREWLGPAMGPCPDALYDASTSSKAGHYLQIYGYAWTRLGSELSVTVCFEDVSYGAPALVQWLHDQGCRRSKYEFENPNAGGYDE